MPFEISIPEGSAPGTSRPYRINPILAKDLDANLNQYLAAGLIQHSTSPYSSPLVVVPKISGGVRITVNYKKLDGISRLIQLPILRVDQVLDSLGKGRVFSLFDLLTVSSFQQITAHKDTVPLTPFFTPTGLHECLVMPQGSSASPGWFVKVISEAAKGLKQVAAYLDDVIVFDSDPSTHVKSSVPSSSDCASTTLSSLPRKPDSARQTPISWATPSRPWAFAQTPRKCRL